MPAERAPRPLTGLLHLAALWNLAIAQPVFDILARSPEFFVAHDAQAAYLWMFVLVLSAGAPLAVWVVLHGLARIVPAIWNAGVPVVCGALLLLIALYALTHAGVASPAIAIITAGIVSIAGAVSYVRYSSVRMFATLLGTAVIVVPAGFLLQPAVSRLIAPDSRAALPLVDFTSTPPVVMVVFDEVPLATLLDDAGQIDAGRFPNFDALRRDATWFRNASAAAELTVIAVPPILTGIPPEANRLPVADDYPANLFTLLAPQYRMHVVESTTGLCPADVCASEHAGVVEWLGAVLPDVAVVYLHTILPEGLTQRLPPVTQNWRDFVSIENWQGTWANWGNSDRPATLETFIEQIGTEPPGDRPTFHFVHEVFPHEPWVYLPTGQRFSETGTVAGFSNGHGKWVSEPDAVAFDYRRHLLQVGLADALLGRLITRLRETGVYDEALIIVTADHGASFRPGQSFRQPTAATFADIAAVPLFIKRPHQRDGSVVAANVSTIDIPATVAAALGVRLPWPSDGANIVEAVPTSRRRKMLFYDGGRQRIEGPGDLTEGLRDAVAALRQLVPSADPFEQPNRGRAHELIDQSLERFAIRPGTARVTLDNAAALRDVNPDGRYIPSRIAGSVVTVGATRPTLAIAVNGIVAATTMPYPFPVAGRPNLWEVLVHPRVFMRGGNTVNVVEVREGPDNTLVLHSTSVEDAADGSNMAGESARWLAGVTSSGLYPTEWMGAQPFRWSTGDARLSIPVDPSAPPSALSVKVVMTAGPDTSLHIASGRCVLFDGILQGAWSETLSLDSCPIESDRMDLVFRSTARTPANGDPRELSIAVASVALE